MTNTSKTAPKPRRGVGSVITRRRRMLAEQMQRRESGRSEEQRERARTVVHELRYRHQYLNDPIYAFRQNAARHAINVLTADHKAFLAAVGHGNIKLSVVLSDGHLQDQNARTGVAEKTIAWTDFSKIVVRVPSPPAAKTLKEFVVEVRGILHHEAGHVRFTTPLPDLYQSAVEVSSSVDRVPLVKLHKVWNCLEDQRMEAAVVRATPRIKNYFIPMVLNVVVGEDTGADSTVATTIVSNLGPWMSLAGRSYMPDDIRIAARERFDQHGSQFGVTAEDWFNAVSRYMSATDNLSMMMAVLDAYDLLTRILDTASGDNPSLRAVIEELFDESMTNPNEQHTKMSAVRYDDDDKRLEESASMPNAPKPNKPADKKGKEEEEEHDGDADADAASDRDADGENDTASDGDKTDTSPGGGAKTNERPTDDMQKAAEEAVNAVLESAEIADVMSRINSRVGAGAVPSETDEFAHPMESATIDAAMSLSREIQDALEVFRTEKSPTWARHQERGYLDAMAYRTREPGERTYHREPQNWDSNGLGVHVSFLADRSGSMNINMRSLSTTMWAVKVACVNLGIPNTMVLWADAYETARVLEDDCEPLVFITRGGTNPLVALEDLDSHVTEDGLHHLVFIFTDGTWSNVQSLAEWRRDDRTFVIIGLDCESSIINKDADVAIPISSIGQLGAHVKAVLAEQVGSR